MVGSSLTEYNCKCRLNRNSKEIEMILNELNVKNMKVDLRTHAEKIKIMSNSFAENTFTKTGDTELVFVEEKSIYAKY